MTDIHDNPSPKNDEMDGGLDEEGNQLDDAMELEMWKTRAERADDLKEELILQKLEKEDAKTKAQQDMLTYANRQEEYQEESTQTIDAVQKRILELDERRRNLLDKLRGCQVELEAKRDESVKLRQKFKIWIEISNTEVKFRGQNKEEKEDNNQLIRGVFAISQRPSVLLHGGQALITFEEEKVASQMVKIAKSSVSCDSGSLDVKSKRFAMDPVIRFEVHLDVSRRKLKISNVPSSMPEERIKDRLEMSFSRPSKGGGEVESVEYVDNTRTGQITFLHPGVAENLALRGHYCVKLDTEWNVEVGPIYTHHLRKFQTFCGTPKRTILLDDIEDIMDEEDLQDHLEIHFQKPSNHGGEIEHIRYTAKGKALQTIFQCEDMAVVNN